MNRVKHDIEGSLTMGPYSEACIDHLCVQEEIKASDNDKRLVKGDREDVGAQVGWAEAGGVRKRP